MSIWNSVGHDVHAENGAREQGSINEDHDFAVDVATCPYSRIRLALWAVDSEQAMVRGGAHVTGVLTPEYAAKLRDNLTEALDLIGYVTPNEETS